VKNSRLLIEFMIEVEAGVKFNEWLDQVESFMIANKVDSFMINHQIETLVINALGAHKIPKSKEQKRKIFIDSIMADGKKRFMILNKNNMQHVGLVLKAEWLQDALESWRGCVAEFLAGERSPVDLSRLGSSVRRPWPCGLPLMVGTSPQNDMLGIPRYASLKETLHTDPLNRFKFIGEGSTSLVTLFKKPDRSKTSPVIGTTVEYHDNEWTLVKKKQQQLNHQMKLFSNRNESTTNKSETDFKTGMYPLDWGLDDDSVHSDSASSTNPPFESDLSRTAPAWNPPGMWDIHPSPDRHGTEETGLSDPFFHESRSNHLPTHEEASSVYFSGLGCIVENDTSSTTHAHSVPLESVAIPADEGSAGNVKSDPEEDRLKELWLENIETFIRANQIESLRLSYLGTSVPKPKELMGKVKLADLLAWDPLQRFVVLNPVGAPAYITLNISSERAQELTELWRSQIVDFLATVSHPLVLTIVGSSVHRPWPLPKSPSLKEVLMTDPFRRFKMSGEGNGIAVTLANKRIKRRKPISEGVSTGDQSIEQHQQPLPLNILRPEMTTTVSSAANGGNDEMENLLNSFKLKLDDNGGTHSHFTPPLDSDLSLHAPTWNSPNMWNAPDSGNHMDMFPQDNSNSSFTSYPNNEAPASVYFSGLAYIAESDSAIPTPSNPQDIPVMSPFHDMALPQSPPGLSSMLSSMGNSLGGSSMGINSNSELLSVNSRIQQHQPPSALSTAAPANEHHQVWLKDWLPGVLDGFPSSLIDSFIQALQEDGFISVNDLIIAQSMDQLTFEYLRSMGFKMGHFNRLITSLKGITN